MCLPPLLLSWDDVKLTTLSCGLVLFIYFFLNFVFVGLLYDPIVTLVVCVHGPHTFLSVD